MENYDKSMREYHGNLIAGVIGFFALLLLLVACLYDPEPYPKLETDTESPEYRTIIAFIEEYDGTGVVLGHMADVDKMVWFDLQVERTAYERLLMKWCGKFGYKSTRYLNGKGVTGCAIRADEIFAERYMNRREDRAVAKEKAEAEALIAEVLVKR